MAQTLTHISKYRIEGELGRGAMGVVYKAFDPVVERMVAIKTIRLDVEDAEELINRLRREAKSVGQLEHPNIVTLYDAGESGGLFYLAMQFIQGETLQDRLARQRWFTLSEVQDIIRQVCAGLGYAHQHGVIHRDIKPANIMITPDGAVKLTDFGIAKLAAAGSTTTGLIVGTPSYMSPEQALGRFVDNRSDIFSLGSIVYELTTGEKAFPGQNTTTVMYKIVHEAPTPLRAVHPGLDPAVEAIVLKALAKNPEERFQTCGELSTALDLYLERAIASMKKTSIGATLPTPTPITEKHPTPPTSPVISQLPKAAAQGSSIGLSPAEIPPPAPSAVTQTLPGQAGRPLAWAGGGILATLFLVVIVLLIEQMRRPATVMAPVGPPAGSSAPTSQPAALPPAAIEEGNTSQGAPSAAQPTPRQRIITGKISGAPKPSGLQNRPGPSHFNQRSSATTTNQVTASAPATSTEPATFDALLLKGDLAFQSSHYQDALSAYSKAYRLNPNSRELRRKIAVVLTLLGRPEEAQKYQ